MRRRANPFEWIDNRICFIRGQSVLLDEDLAGYYGKRLSRLFLIVKKHAKCFPPEIMFKLSRQEFAILKPQLTTFKTRKRRYSPMAFTRSGVAMLSMILNKEYPFKKSQTCERKCLVYSRDFICIHPVSHWNKGKKEEFKDRECFVIPPLKTIASKKTSKKQ